MGLITDAENTLASEIFIIDIDEQIARTAWTYLVRRKADFKCEVCFSELQLISHHIDENKENNCLKNGKCLCRSCHGKLHWSDPEWRENTIKKNLEGRELLLFNKEGWQELIDSLPLEEKEIVLEKIKNMRDGLSSGMKQYWDNKPEEERLEIGKKLTKSRGQ